MICAWQVFTNKLSEKGKVAEKMVLQEMRETVCIGKVPVMVKSKLCNLFGLTDTTLRSQRGDCDFDIGGYFIVKGSEKVRNTQPRMSLP